MRDFGWFSRLRAVTFNLTASSSSYKFRVSHRVTAWRPETGGYIHTTAGDCQIASVSTQENWGASGPF